MRHEELVEKLKNELCSVACMNQEEVCLEIENTREKNDDTFTLDVRDECFEEREKDKESEKDIESDKNIESEEMEESDEEKEHEESEEKDECENEDLLCRPFDG